MVIDEAWGRLAQGDVARVIEKGVRQEQKGSSGKYALEVICDNIDMAKVKSQPLCQDTGTIICYAELPPWLDEWTFRSKYD